MTSYQIYYPTLKCIFLDKFHFFHQYTKLLYRHNIVVRVRVMVFNPLSTIFHLQSNLYLEVMFGTKKNWTHKTGDLLKEVQFIWNFLWQNKTRVTFQYRWSHGQVWLYIEVVSVIGGGNQSTWRKPLTCRKSLINLIK
jgi:hypothetical protein